MLAKEREREKGSVTSCMEKQNNMDADNMVCLFSSGDQFYLHASHNM